MDEARGSLAPETNREANIIQGGHKGTKQGGTSNSAPNKEFPSQQMIGGGSLEEDNGPGGTPNDGRGPGEAKKLYSAGIT